MTPPPIIGSRCPVCAKPARTEHAPFCSRGCRDRDLLAWLGGDYQLPGRHLDDRLDSPGDAD